MAVREEQDYTLVKIANKRLYNVLPIYALLVMYLLCSALSWPGSCFTDCFQVFVNLRYLLGVTAEANESRHKKVRIFAVTAPAAHLAQQT